MPQIKKTSFIILMVLVLIGTNSCGLFKGKNKCGDCPTWSQIETQKNVQKAVNV